MSLFLEFTDFMAGGGLYGTPIDKIDMAPQLAAIFVQIKNTLGLIKSGPVARNVEFNHIEDDLNPSTITGQYTTSSTTFDPADTVQADLNRKLRMTAVSGGLNVHLQSADGLMTIRRTVDTQALIVGDSNWELIAGTGANKAAGTIFYILLPKPDEEAASRDTSKIRTRRKGFCRVFERALEETKTRMGIDLYAVPAELQHQAMMRTMEAVNEMNAAIIRDHIYITGGVPVLEDNRLMTGIIQQLRDPELDGTASDPLTFNATSVWGSTFGKVHLDGMIRKLFDAGGLDASDRDHAFIVHPDEKEKIAILDESLRREGVDWRKAGYTVTTFISKLTGEEYPIHVDRAWPSGMMGLLDFNRIERRDFDGDTWGMGEVSLNTTRARKQQVSGQFGMSVKNVDKSHVLAHTVP